MGTVGSLGEVAYSIVCDNETGKGLTAVADNFRVTAGDVVASIKQISDAVAQFDDLNTDVGRNISFSSLSIGTSTAQVIEWAKAVSGPEDNIREMTGAIYELTRAGVISGEEIPGALKSWDNFADGIGESADKAVREWAPAMKSMGLSMSEIGVISDRVTWAVHNTTLTSSDLLGVFTRMGPEMHAAGLTGADVIDMLALIESHGYKGKNAIAELNAAMSKNNDINGDGVVSREEMLAFLEISPGEAAALTTKINEQSAGYTNTSAAINNQYIPAAEKVKNVQDNAIAGNVAYTGSITGIASAFSTVFEKLDWLIPFIAIKLPGAIAGSNIGAAISSSLSGLSGSFSAIGTALAGSLVVGIAGGIALGLGGIFVLVKTGIMDGITNLGAEFGEWLAGSDLGNVILDAMAILLSPFTSLFEGIFAAMKGEDIASAMLKPFEYAGIALGQIMNDMESTAYNGVMGIANAFRGLGSSLAGASGQVTAMAMSAFSGISGAFQGMAGQITGVFNQLMSAIQAAINSTAGGFFNAGQNIITNLVNGIVAAAGGIINAIRNIMQQIGNLFPLHSPAKEGPLSKLPDWDYVGESAAAAAGSTKTNVTSMVKAASDGINDTAAKGATTPGTPATTPAGDNITFNIYQQPGQNAKELADMVIQQFAAVRKQRGIRS